jgi:hypothetical protein
MARPTWPPNYTRVPIHMLLARGPRGERLPAGVLETWLDFRAMAWGQQQTPPMEFSELKSLLGKGRSTVCGHLTTLRDWFGQRWEIRQERLTVFFDDVDTLADVDSTRVNEPADRVQESGLVQKAGLATAQEMLENTVSPESRTLDSALNPLNKTESLIIKEGGAVQISGPRSRNLDSAQKRQQADPRSKSPAIQACRNLVNRYPDLTLYDRIIGALGERPDIAKLKACRVEWLERGFNPTSWKWVTDWYPGGIPEQKRPTNGGISNAHRASPAKNNQPTASQLARDRQIRAERDAQSGGD